MIVRFVERTDGVDVYRVERCGEPVFAGRRAECLRYVAVHREKIRRAEEGSGRRRGPWTTVGRAPWGPGVVVLGPPAESAVGPDRVTEGARRPRAPDAR